MSYEIPAGSRKADSPPSMRTFIENHPAMVKAICELGTSAEEASAAFREAMKTLEPLLRGGA